MSMNVDVKRWLADRFHAIDSVRSARLSREDMIAVYTWSGVIIYVYVLSKPIKARAIKRILQDNTRIGVGTLLIVDADLVPEDGVQVTPDEGLLALHALFKDKLYTYRQQGDTILIGQVHFKAFNRGDEREVWYGPDVPVSHLPSYRVWISAPQSIKGNWLIANFGTEAFWKQADYTAGRSAFRQQQRRSSGETHYSTWSNGWNESGGQTYTTPAAPPPETDLDRSYRQLGLTRAASGDEVKAAFRRLAREVHPDVSNLPKDEAEARFKVIYDAYSLIKSANRW